MISIRLQTLFAVKKSAITSVGAFGAPVFRFARAERSLKAPAPDGHGFPHEINRQTGPGSGGIGPDTHGLYASCRGGPASA